MSIENKKNKMTQSFSDIKKQIKNRKDLTTEPLLSDIPIHILTLAKPFNVTEGYWFENDIDFGYIQSGTAMKNNALSLNNDIYITSTSVIRELNFVSFPNFTIIGEYSMTGINFKNWPSSSQASRITEVKKYGLSNNIFNVNPTFSSLVTIGDSAFRNCNFKSGFTFSSALKTIGDSAFRSSTFPENTTLIIPSTVTSVGSQAFNEASNLKIVNYNANTATFPRILFYGCKQLETAVVSRATKYTDRNFYGCENLKSVTLGSSGRAVTSIASNVFQYCSNLTQITIYVSNTTTGLTGAPWGATNANIKYVKA